MPPISALYARDERRSGEFKETEAEQVLHLGPDPLDRFSVEPGTVEKSCSKQVFRFAKKHNALLGVMESTVSAIIPFSRSDVTRGNANV